MKRNVKGITLIEVVLTLAILGIVITSIYTVFFAGQNAFSTGTNKGLAQESVRLAEVFLTDELKNTTGFISKGDFENKMIKNQKIYRLKYEKEYLLLSEYKYNVENSSYDQKDLRKLKGNWNKFIVSSLANGLLDVSIEQKEELYNRESTYPLDFSIKLVNNDNLRNDEVWDLISGDELYFVKSDDALFGQIKIKEGTESGGSTGTGGGETSSYKEIIIENIKIVKNGNKEEIYEFIGNPTENPFNISIGQGQYDIEITLNEKYDNLNVSLINSTYDIIMDGTIIKLNKVKLNKNIGTVTINIGYPKSQPVDTTKSIIIIASN